MIIRFYDVLESTNVTAKDEAAKGAEDGTVFVNGEELEEPYIDEKALGECDIEFPYQVPESRIFVMGDHRATSVDSRTSMVGCIADEYIIGRLIFRVWPFKAISPL